MNNKRKPLHDLDNLINIDSSDRLSSATINSYSSTPRLLDIYLKTPSYSDAMKFGNNE